VSRKYTYEQIGVRCSLLLADSSLLSKGEQGLISLGLLKLKIQHNRIKR
jgi:hypothetical protein